MNKKWGTINTDIDILVDISDFSDKDITDEFKRRTLSIDHNVGGLNLRQKMKLETFMANIDNISEQDLNQLINKKM